MKKADMELFAREHEMRRKTEKETMEKILVSLIQNAVEQRRDEDFLLGLEKAATFVIKYGFSHNDKIMIFYKSMDTDCVNYRRMLHVMEYLGIEMCQLKWTLDNVSWDIKDARYMYESITRFETRKRCKFVEYLSEHYEGKTLLQIACDLSNLNNTPSDTRSEQDKKTAEKNMQETGFYVFGKDRCEIDETVHSYEKVSKCTAQYMEGKISISELLEKRASGRYGTVDAMDMADYECCCNATVTDIPKLERLLNENASPSPANVTMWTNIKRYVPDGHKMAMLLKTLGLISFPYCTTYDI